CGRGRSVPDQPPQGRPMSVQQVLGRVTVAILLLAAIAVAFVDRQSIHYAEIEQEIAHLGGLAPLAYIALYVIATVLLLPGSILALAAGVLFGPVLGSFYALAGATVGATLAFLVARYLAVGTGRLDRTEAVGQYRTEDVDHLPITVIGG